MYAILQAHPRYESTDSQGTMWHAMVWKKIGEAKTINEAKERFGPAYVATNSPFWLEPTLRDNKDFHRRKFWRIPEAKPSL